MHQELEQQKEERRMSVYPDVFPKVMPVVLLCNENVPVAVILDELRRSQHEPGNGGNQCDNDEAQSEPVTLVCNLQGVFPPLAQPKPVTYSWEYR